MATVKAASKPLGFWALGNKRPESIVGKAALLAGGTYAAYLVLPIINTIVWNTVSILTGGAILGLAWILLADGRLVRLIDYMFQVGVRKLTGIFIAVAPIDIMKVRLRELNSLYDQVSKRIAELRGARRKTFETLQQYIRERDDHDQKTEMALKHPSEETEGDKEFVAFHASAAARRDASITKFEGLVAQMDAGLKILEKVQRKAKFVIADIEDTVTHLESERAALKASVGAIRAMKKILSGGDIGGEFYDMAIEITNQQAAEMIGEIQQFMVDSRDLMREFDLEQYAAVEAAVKRLERRDQEARLTSYEKGDATKVIEHAPGEAIPMARAPADSLAEVRNFLDSGKKS